MSLTKINIAEIQPVSENLGPGKRFIIWVQGCPFKCKNCISPEWIPFKVNKPTTIERLAKKIIDTEDIEGVTISGGEPFMQAKQLVEVIKIVRIAKPKFNVIVFTGFKLKRLHWDEAKELLSQIDVLIDGLYVDELNDNKGLRGSSNQTVHYLTERLKSSKEYFNNRERDLEVHNKRDGKLIIGIPPKKDNLSYN